MKKCFHGGDLAAFAGMYGKKQSEILDFSSNVNPLGLPESVREACRRAAEELERYPAPYSEPLCGFLADRFSLKPEQVMAGNGSFGALQAAFQVLEPKHVLLLEPCFSEYRRLAENTGAHVRTLRLSAGDSFAFSAEKILKILKGADLLVLGHPNNPTGTALERNGLLELIREARRKKVFVILDEAFADWTPGISVASEAGKPGFLVVRSLTKFFALAGIRAGYALGPAKLIAAMQNAQGPWACNHIAQQMSLAALRDTEFQEKTRRWFQVESRRFYSELAGFGFLKVYPSLANFFLIKSEFPGLPEYLGKQGIYARPSTGFRGLNASFFRLALKTREENQALVRALEKVPAEAAR